MGVTTAGRKKNAAPRSARIEVDLGPADIALPPPARAQQAMAALAARPCGQAPPGGLPELRELLAVHLTRAGQARDAARAAVIVWNSPHNATGRVASAEECQQAAEFARRHHLFLISDEVCHDLTWSVPHASPLEWADRERSAGVWSASKSLRMAGYRSDGFSHRPP